MSEFPTYHPLKEEVVSSILEHTTHHGAIAGKTQETKVKYYNNNADISEMETTAYNERRTD